MLIAASFCVTGLSTTGVDGRFCLSCVNTLQGFRREINKLLIHWLHKLSHHDVMSVLMMYWLISLTQHDALFFFLIPLTPIELDISYLNVFTSYARYTKRRFMSRQLRQGFSLCSSRGILSVKLAFCTDRKWHLATSQVTVLPRLNDYFYRYQLHKPPTAMTG